MEGLNPDPYYWKAVGYLNNKLCPSCENHPRLVRKSWKDYFRLIWTCPECGHTLAGC